MLPQAQIKTLSQKVTDAKRAGDHKIECPLSKYEASRSTPSSAKKEKKSM
jgi:hypothetical protein